MAVATLIRQYLPKKTHSFSSEHFNSERWNHIDFRDDDIMICTAPKQGTTWMVRIVSLLVHQNPNRIDPKVMDAPWIDAAFLGPIEKVTAEADTITHQRFMKSHIPLNCMDYHPKVKYINVVREPRDGFLSLQNHWKGTSEKIWQMMEQNTPFPRLPQPEEVGDVHERFRRFMTEGKMDWEQDGWPYMSPFSFAESFWKWRHLPNILMVHYTDLKTDLEGEMRRIAQFLEKDIPEADWPSYVNAATFGTMKKDVDKLIPKYNFIFSHGAKGFMQKGRLGEWQSVLNEKDLEIYEKRAAQLDPRLRAWMEHGRLVSEN